MVNHLYVHIPFCPKVCPYCSFYKEASDRNKTKDFLEALLREAEEGAEGVNPRTVFFGGGTPTALSTPQLQFLIRGLRERISFPAQCEFTLEMNPATVSLEKAVALLELGVNRVSMGVQSWDDRLLETLGRVHSAALARRSFQILREAGVPSVNLDLIFGIPGQTEGQWRDTLMRTIDLGPDHISAYCLTYEEDTEFFLRFQGGEFAPLEQRDADFFEIAMDALEAAGFLQYEISNYAKPGHECLHNLAYWQGEDYFGLGPSAFSTRNGLRWRNIPDTTEYTRRVLSGRDARDFQEEVGPGIRRTERLAFLLRTSGGVPLSEIPGFRFSPLVSSGLALIGEGRLVLTRKGRMVADQIASELI